jgi:O-antigen/teichoic acid export membrane protein
MVKNYAYYFIGIMIGRVASLLLLPIYTSYLSPADYGVLELLSMVLVVGNLIFGCRITQSFFREFGLARNETEKQVAFGSALGLALGVSLFGVITIVLFSAPISQLQFGTDKYAYFVSLFAANLALGILHEVPMAFLKAKENAKAYLLFSVLLLLFQIIFNLTALVVFNAGLAGVVHASVLAYLMFAVIINFAITLRARPKFFIKKAKEMFGFSFPIIFAGICMYFVVYGDRYFLRAGFGLEEVGIYALAYKFGLILSSVIWGPFSNVWDSEKYIIYNNQLERFYPIIFRIMLLLLATAGIGVVLWIGDFLMLASDESFWRAEVLVPVTIFAYIIFSVTDFFTFSIFLEKKTQHMFHASLVSVATALVGYILLIPPYAGMGAAIATVLAFTTRFIYIYLISKKLYDLKISIYDIVKPLIFFSLVSYAYFFYPLANHKSLNALIYSLITVLIFGAWAFYYRRDLLSYLQIRRNIKN